MGNQSKSGVNQQSTYKTRAGVDVPTDGHSEEWMRKFNRKVDDWLWDGEGSPSSEMNDDEIDYILNNMEDSLDNPDVPTGHLTRIEAGYHILDKIDGGELGVGDKLPSNSKFRSYSRNPVSTTGYYSSSHWPDGPLVIYRTNGNVPHFNTTRFNGSFKQERESWVKQDNLKIDKITRYVPSTSVPQDEHTHYSEGSTTHKELYDELGLGANSDPINALGGREVVLIDVSEA